MNTSHPRLVRRRTLAALLTVAALGAAVVAQPPGPQASPTPLGENSLRTPAVAVPAWAERLLAPSPDEGATRGLVQDPAKEWLFNALPALRTSPAPKWVVPGVRLTYYGASGTVPTSDHHYWPDANGDWVDDAGNRYSRDDTPRGGGEGYTQVTVGYVGTKLVTLDTQLFLISAAGRPPTLFAGAGSVEPAGAAADYWIHPAVLNTIPDEIGRTTATFRMPFTAFGKKYQAIRFHVRGPTGRMTYIFDLASGVMLHMNHIVRTRDATITTFVTYAGRRQLDLPWADGEPPNWVAELRELRYDGAQVIPVPSGSPVSVPVSVRATVTGRGRRWTTFDLTASAAGYEGLPASESTTGRSCGPAQIGGLWIPVDGLADLRRGAVLDEDPVTKLKTTVTCAGCDVRGRKVVEIAQDNGVQRLTYQYDLQTGALTSFGRLDRHLMNAQTTVSLRSVR